MEETHRGRVQFTVRNILYYDANSLAKYCTATRTLFVKYMVQFPNGLQTHTGGNDYQQYYRGFQRGADGGNTLSASTIQSVQHEV